MNGSGLSTEMRELAMRLLEQTEPDGRLNLEPGARVLGEWVFTPSVFGPHRDRPTRTERQGDCPS